MTDLMTEAMDLIRAIAVGEFTQRNRKRAFDLVTRFDRAEAGPLEDFEPKS